MPNPHNITAISFSSKKFLQSATLTAAVICGLTGSFIGAAYELSVLSLLAMTAISSISAAYLTQTALKYAMKKGAMKPELRFNKVLSVSMIRKVVNKQYANKDITLDNPAELFKEVVDVPQEQTNSDQEFRPATIMYDVLGANTNTDTCAREQAVVNAKLVLLSMDHTKQIPH